MPKSFFLALMAACLLLAACGTSSTDQQTLVAYDATLSADMNDLRATATTQKERLLVTLGFAETQIARATVQLRSMLSTLESLDIDTSQLPAAVTLPPTVAGNVIANAAPTQAFGAVPPRVEVTPFTTTPDATRIAQQAGLTNLVLSTSVGDDDCATNVSSQFSASTPAIYLVGLANFPQETNVIFRWLRESQLISEITWTYAATDVACVWYFVDSTDFEFTPGSYSVSVEVNGITLPPLRFTITS
ncbi:MAG: hypothetical protein OHK0046_28970 [Anaerolineae bacterium]